MSESCGNPTTESEPLMPRRRKYDKTNMCVRCKENSGSLVIRHAVYCKTCFIPFMTHKFRRSLEPLVNVQPDGPRRTALKPQGNLLIGFSGGLGSTVLLDLVHRYYVAPDKHLVTVQGGSHHPRKDRVWSRVVVCYVEVCDAFPEMKDRTNDARVVVERYGGFEFVPLRLQDAFDQSWWKRSGRESASLSVNMTNEFMSATQSFELRTPVDAMRLYISSLPTPTARSTAVQTLTRVLLQYTASSNSCSHLVLGTSLTSLAVSLISGVALGGGFHVKEEIQEEWTPDQDQSDVMCVPQKRSRQTLRILRPLRDVGMKECAAWAWWMGLEVVGRESWDWPGAKPGIRTLTRAFITGLEKDYPSTISTIVRTCGKLAPKGTVSRQCISCERPVQQGIQDWQARISIRSRTDESTSKTPRSAIVESLSPFLCYTCHTTFTSRSSRPTAVPYSDFTPNPNDTPLPMWMGRTWRLPSMNVHDEDEEIIVKKLNRAEMRNTVKDFLLDDQE